MIPCDDDDSEVFGQTDTIQHNGRLLDTLIAFLIYMTVAGLVLAVLWWVGK
jgi:hypothetical protein